MKKLKQRETARSYELPQASSLSELNDILDKHSARCSDHLQVLQIYVSISLFVHDPLLN